MEKELFDCTGWDEVDVAAYVFYNAKFHKDFGPFKAGVLYGSVTVDYQNGFIEAYNESGVEVLGTANIKLSLAE